MSIGQKTRTVIFKLLYWLGTVQTVHCSNSPYHILHELTNFWLSIGQKTRTVIFRLLYWLGTVQTVQTVWPILKKTIVYSVIIPIILVLFWRSTWLAHVTVCLRTEIWFLLKYQYIDFYIFCEILLYYLMIKKCWYMKHSFHGFHLNFENWLLW